MKVGIENLGQLINRLGESAADKDIEIIEFRMFWVYFVIIKSLKEYCCLVTPAQVVL